MSCSAVAVSDAAVDAVTLADSEPFGCAIGDERICDLMLSDAAPFAVTIRDIYCDEIGP